MGVDSGRVRVQDAVGYRRNLERPMPDQHLAEPAAIRVQLAAIFVSLELSRSNSDHIALPRPGRADVQA